jgi:hypothetical protein
MQHRCCDCAEKNCEIFAEEICEIFAEEICEIFCSGKSVRSFAGQKINQ